MNVIYPFLLYLLLYEPLASVLYRIFHDALGLDLTRLFCLLCSGLFVLVLELDLLRRGPGTYSDFHRIKKWESPTFPWKHSTGCSRRKPVESWNYLSFDKNRVERLR